MKFIARTLEGDSEPMTQAEVKALVASGKITREDMIRPEGEQKWYRAGKVKGLFPKSEIQDSQSASPSAPPAPSSGQVVEYVERPVPTPAPAQRVSVEVRRQGNSLGLVSLILGIVAFVICWIPLIGMLGIPLSAIGLVLAIIGLIVALTRKGASIGYPIGGGLICLVALGVALTMTSAIIGGAQQAMAEFNETMDEIDAGLDELGSAEATESMIITPQVDDAISTPSNPVADASESERDDPEAMPEPAPPAIQWAGFSDMIEQDGIRVSLADAVVGKVDVKDYDGVSQSVDDLLAIDIRIENTLPTKIVTYRSFAGREISFGSDSARIKDNFDNSYRLISFGYSGDIVGRVDFEDIRPGDVITDRLVFQLPIDATEELFLELPAQVLGGDGWFRFRIPIEQVRR